MDELIDIQADLTRSKGSWDAQVVKNHLVGEDNDIIEPKFVQVKLEYTS